VPSDRGDVRRVRTRRSKNSLAVATHAPRSADRSVEGAVAQLATFDGGEVPRSVEGQTTVPQPSAASSSEPLAPFPNLMRRRPATRHSTRQQTRNRAMNRAWSPPKGVAKDAADVATKPAWHPRQPVCTPQSANPRVILSRAAYGNWGVSAAERTATPLRANIAPSAEPRLGLQTNRRGHD
jgi:hypothetical protein